MIPRLESHLVGLAARLDSTAPYWPDTSSERLALEERILWTSQAIRELKDAYPVSVAVMERPDIEYDAVQYKAVPMARYERMVAVVEAALALRDGWGHSDNYWLKESFNGAVKDFVRACTDYRQTEPA